MSVQVGESAATHSLAELPRDARLRLLDGPTIHMRIMYNGTQSMWDHQIQAAKAVTNSTRCKQLEEGANALFNHYTLVLPRRAMMAVSPLLHHMFTEYPDRYEVQVDFGGILPGYGLSAIDFYFSALRGDIWSELKPPVLCDNIESFHYFYVYVAMRLLDMDALAVHLEEFLKARIEDVGLGDNYEALTILLQHLEPVDPVFVSLAARYQKFFTMGSRLACPLSEVQLSQIFQSFPRFHRMVAEGNIRNEVYALIYGHPPETDLDVDMDVDMNSSDT